MARLFAAGVLVSTFMACGAQVDDGGPVGSQNVGGTPSTGGATSVSTSATGGAASTGGPTGIDWSTYCDGLFAGQVCTAQIITNVTSCDIPLQRSPYPISAVQVAFDCNRILYVSPDAGISGFYIDYGWTPAHLEVTGPLCTGILTSGLDSLAVVEGCVSTP